MGRTPLSILVVEDHADTRAVLGMFLKLLGHRCAMAGDADAALAQAAGGRFDALLTDVRLPGADGWELVRELAVRGHLPARVISMSAGFVKGESARSGAAGCHAHLVKPFKTGELEGALQAPDRKRPGWGAAWSHRALLADGSAKD